MNTTAHILVTSLCDRDCPSCCNKQYDLNDVPYITDDELKQIKHVYLTGGEPFVYSNPCEIARKLRLTYKNIDSVIVYSNVHELYNYLMTGGELYCIDGITMSIKCEKDKSAFEHVAENPDVLLLPKNRLYVFPSFEDTECPDSIVKMNRQWQTVFTPAPNSIFRRL